MGTYIISLWNYDNFNILVLVSHRKSGGVDPPEMHAVSRKVRVPRIAHTPVRLCFEFLSYDFSVSNICLTLVF